MAALVLVLVVVEALHHPSDLELVLPELPALQMVQALVEAEEEYPWDSSIAPRPVLLLERVAATADYLRLGLVCLDPFKSPPFPPLYGEIQNSNF